VTSTRVLATDPPFRHRTGMSSKWAVVTGAGKRLGLEVARRLGRRGFTIVAHANGSTAGAEELRAELGAEGCHVHVVRADLASEEGQGALVEAVRALTPRLDAIVHNAGIFERVPFEAIDRARYARMQAINTEAPFFVTQGLLGELRAAPAPCVVHVTDIAADRPIPGYAHYSVSKAGLVMLTRALASELAPHVRVNAVAPLDRGLGPTTPGGQRDGATQAVGNTRRLCRGDTWSVAQPLRNRPDLRRRRRPDARVLIVGQRLRTSRPGRSPVSLSSRRVTVPFTSVAL